MVLFVTVCPPGLAVVVALGLVLCVALRLVLCVTRGLVRCVALGLIRYVSVRLTRCAWGRPVRSYLGRCGGCGGWSEGFLHRGGNLRDYPVRAFVGCSKPTKSSSAVGLRAGLGFPNCKVTIFLRYFGRFLQFLYFARCVFCCFCVFRVCSTGNVGGQTGGRVVVGGVTVCRPYIRRRWLRVVRVGFGSGLFTSWLFLRRG